MCHVQRVTNSCGHINDHVLMACYLAKDVTPSPSPSPTPSTFTITQESYTSISAPSADASKREQQSQSQTQHQDKGGHTQSREKGESSSIRSERSGKSKISMAQIQGRGECLSISEEEDMIQRLGFDARNQPYCKLKFPKALDSPKGFKCMVFTCGRVD
ncbi:uncharacterized protein DSM5745_03044 [Aspergillus mulundensis]|uniref:Uncharacterized protein n=1 Tax=Aspergillus mulundensis TaxID=1810919 RepID=A0A3D8SJF2_9EURO|nr:hypothetical protein DSM5745_03044 [Aspergillus mulundensis]RDW86402.1 hypothetical protein DSM5745_03044 [Aspergillus mulundensis]